MNAKTKTVTISGTVYYDTAHIEGSENYPLYTFKVGNVDPPPDCVPIMPFEFCVEIPADFDPRPQQIKALEAQRQELHGKFAAAVLEIDQRINSLLALEMS